MRTTSTLICLGLALGGIRLFQMRPPARMNVAGASASQPKGIAWGVVICPPEGAVVEQLAFVAQGTSLDGALSHSTLIAEDHGSGTTLCSLTVPCTVPVADTVSTSDCSAARCTPGGPVHIEWAPDLPDGGSVSGCLLGGFPAGAGSATLRVR